MTRDFMLLKDLDSTVKIKRAVRKIFSKYNNLLPESKKSRVFLKPNFNSDMISLTGNTTDFRLIVAIITELQRRGYENITVGDGTSSGFINAGIDVLERLGVKELGKHLGVKVLDLNKGPVKTINLMKEKVKVAKICIDNDLFINLPKIKTHAEAGFTCCMKNLIGCVSGSLEKQKIHHNLFKNIPLLNRVLKPDLNIIDGLVSMEGTGPSMGKPVKTNIIMAGTSSNLLDYLVSRMFRINAPYIKDLGFKVKTVKKFKEPKPSLLFKAINGRLRPLFSKLRYNKFFYKILSSNAVSSIMKFVGARQDLFDKRDAEIKLELIDDNYKNKVIPFCPLGYKYGAVAKCRVKCLYCPVISNKVRLVGSKNYFNYQLKILADYYKGVKN